VTVLAIVPKDLVIFYNHLVSLVVRSAGLFVCMSVCLSLFVLSLESYQRIPILFNTSLVQVHAKPISIHAPMTRLLAGLSLFLEKFELDFSTSHELDILEKPSVVELVSIL
jgi:hypothetical protein